MTEISKLLKVFDELEIEYTRRKKGEYEYVFVGECRNMYNPDWNFETTDLDSLTRTHGFYEFENGKLASYSNS